MNSPIDHSGSEKYHWRYFAGYDDAERTGIREVLSAIDQENPGMGKMRKKKIKTIFHQNMKRFPTRLEQDFKAAPKKAFDALLGLSRNISQQKEAPKAAAQTLTYQPTCSQPATNGDRVNVTTESALDHPLPSQKRQRQPDSEDESPAPKRPQYNSNITIVVFNALTDRKITQIRLEFLIDFQIHLQDGQVLHPRLVAWDAWCRFLADNCGYGPNNHPLEVHMCDGSGEIRTLNDLHMALDQCWGNSLEVTVRLKLNSG